MEITKSRNSFDGSVAEQISHWGQIKNIQKCVCKLFRSKVLKVPRVYELWLNYYFQGGGTSKELTKEKNYGASD